jgi:oligosaccharyltransferase complex subunit epsilon
MAPPRASGVPTEALSSLLSGGVARDVWRAYARRIPASLQVVDALLVYVLWCGAVLFAYALAVGSFPFNAFLAAFLSCVGVFVLTVALRMQINPVNVRDPANRWEALTPQRAYADWLFCNLILHMAVLNFVG